jgi:hypothetical protein
MYYAYCLVPTLQSWTPARRLATGDAAFAYVRLQHQLFPEIRITDEDDHCVLHIIQHVMYCPLPDGTFSVLDLQTGAQRLVTRAEVDAACQAQPTPQEGAP